MNPQKLTPLQAIELLKKGIAHPSLKLSQQEHFNLLNAIKIVEEEFKVDIPKEVKDVLTKKEAK